MTYLAVLLVGVLAGLCIGATLLRDILDGVLWWSRPKASIKPIDLTPSLPIATAVHNVPAIRRREVAS